MDEIRATDDKPTKIHPKERAGIVSSLFFFWTFPTFYKSMKRDINENEMGAPLKIHDANMLGNKLEKAWMKEVETHREPVLWRPLFKVFGPELFSYAMAPILMDFVLKVSQPLCLRQLLLYYEPNQTSMTKMDAYKFASLIILANFLLVMIVHQYMLGLQQLGMKIRIACCSLIYRKALRLSTCAVAETTVGQMVNLISNDVNRFNFIVLHFHNLWVAPLAAIIIMFLLYINLGLPSLAGCGLFIIFVPVQMFLGKMTSVFRRKTAIKTDQRVRLMNEIITGIQVIKMYTWEKPFEKLVEIARKLEIHQIKSNSYIRAINFSFSSFMTRTAIFLSILTYVLTENRLDAQYVFVVTSFYGVLRQSLMMSLPLGVTVLAETHVSLQRIKTFLLHDEIQLNDDDSLVLSKSSKNGTSIKNRKDSIPLVQQKKIGIHLQDASTKWIQSAPDNILYNINFNAEPRQLIGIVGPVGSGKTTLLHAILKELPLTSGTIEIGGRISYASQQPWLFAGSIRQNITFGETMDMEKYKKVVKVCALERDFSLFPYADKTVVGEKGVMLSGGQKARINLARAIYKDADIYLLDDPLSAVDTQVGKQLFDNCIVDYLKNKCTVLVTHQLQYLRVVDKIYLLENGTITDSGTYNDLLTSEKDFLKLLEVEPESEEEDIIELKRIKSAKSLEEVTDAPLEVKEHMSTGKVKGKVYKKYISSVGSMFLLIPLILIVLLCQLAIVGADYFLTFWVNLEQMRSQATQNNTAITDEIISNSTETMGNSLLSYFDEILTGDICIYIYTVLIILIVTLTFTRSMSFLLFCLKAATRLHNNMFAKIAKAPMRFYNTNPSGRILNRFAKDIGSIDEELPMTITDTIQIGLNVIAITLVITSVSLWILIPSVVVLFIFYWIRVVFLRTSRNMKRMEGTTRSPVFTHLTATIQGLTTIRAFGAQQVLKQEFDKHQDLHSSVFYLYTSCNRTFGFWLDMHCVVFTAIVILSFLFIGTETFAGNVGLAITQSITLTGMFQWGMRQWSELENQMTAVERVIEYSEIPPESDNEIKKPPQGWPEFGNIEFQSLSLRYAIDEPFVLQNLTFKIRSQEKIGIVGRTGAGKSSLIAALFRLAETNGKILIDEVNTKEILLGNLRSKISIIPQEPVLFSGTLRKNLDPFEEYSDLQLWNALEDVELKQYVADLAGGLNTKMSEGGSNLSVGQRQLVCLARAVIRNNKILVLDEATANVDPQTDELIQSTIRNKFKDCTVLTIAHRLHTVMDSDRVLVMDAGTAVEFDHPHVLLQNTNGIFYDLVQQTGKGMSDNLKKIAEESHENAGVSKK